MVGGTETELFRWPSARLYLLDGDERALLQRGSFRLFLAMHSRSPHLVAVEATVSDMQWPVGKDCEVSTFTSGRVHFFTFMLQQGLVYELLLDEEDGFSMHMDKLEQLLALYANFEHTGSKAGNSKNLDEDDSRNHSIDMAGCMRTSRAQPNCDYSSFKSTTTEAELDEDAHQMSLAAATGNGLWPHGAESMHEDHRNMMGGDSSGGRVPGASRRIMKRMHQARRMSAVAKLFSKALERGAIRPERHIELYAVPDKCQDGILTAVADMDTVAKVVELVEKRTTLEEVLSQDKDRRLCGSWTLNNVGLQMLLKAVVAANMIAISRTKSHTST